jgi:hypothetical protein
MYLATVDGQDNSPRVRAVVSRDFVNARRSADDGCTNDPSIVSNVLLTCTDVRSPKVTQIQSRDPDNSPAEICWWHEATVGFVRTSERKLSLSYRGNNSGLGVHCTFLVLQVETTSTSTSLAIDWSTEPRLIGSKNGFASSTSCRLR